MVAINDSGEECKRSRLNEVQHYLNSALKAEADGLNILVLVELSDMLAAVDSYLLKNCASITINDLIKQGRQE